MTEHKATEPSKGPRDGQSPKPAETKTPEKVSDKAVRGPKE
jgi:hypothetical protein